MSEKRLIRKGLVSLRRRDRAEALAQLEEAEVALGHVEREAADLRLRYETVKEDIRKKPSGGPITAVRLAAASRHSAVSAAEKRTLEEKLGDLSRREGLARRRRDAAMDAAARAQRALKAIEKNDE